MLLLTSIAPVSAFRTSPAGGREVSFTPPPLTFINIFMYLHSLLPMHGRESELFLRALHCAQRMRNTKIPSLHVEITPLQMERTPLQMEITPLQMEILPLQMEGTPLHVEITPLQMEITPLHMKRTPLQMEILPLQMKMLFLHIKTKQIMIY